MAYSWWRPLAEEPWIPGKPVGWNQQPWGLVCLYTCSCSPPSWTWGTTPPASSTCPTTTSSSTQWMWQHLQRILLWVGDGLQFKSSSDRLFFPNKNISDGFFNDSRLLNGRYRPGHTADALRLLMVYKYGGFYLDLDYVVFNDLTHYHNIVVGNRP